MRVNQQALDRLRAAGLRAEGVATIFEHMGKCVEQFGVAAGRLLISYQSPGDYVEPGDLVPTIILSLEPADVRPNLDSDNGATQD